MSRRSVGAVVLTVVLVSLLTSCAAGPNALSSAVGPQPAGFWLGLWHGLISPITFLISLFTPRVNLYEVVNNGNWYDFGFMVGVSIVFSGVGGARKVRRPRRLATRRDSAAER